MNLKDYQIPPENPCELSTLNDLKLKLEPLIGQHFPLTKKPRTDGNKFLHLVQDTLMNNNPPSAANDEDYNIVPPKKKGVPKFLREYIDTYLITSGENYNLQVWNRNPNTDMVQVEYVNNSKTLTSKDVRFIFGKININTEVIESIFITTPTTIVEKFGKFGVPTSKQQLIVSDIAKKKVHDEQNHIMFYPDNNSISHLTTKTINLNRTNDFREFPKQNQPILSLEKIKAIATSLIGKQIMGSSTRIRGGALEKEVVNLLGYKLPEKMFPQYPDIPNQMLEVKIQDSPTVDLGRYSPQNIETIHGEFTTGNIRYLVVMTDSDTGIVEDIFIGPGSSLGENFSFVSETSVKYQRGIKMSNFEQDSNRIVIW